MCDCHGTIHILENFVDLIKEEDINNVESYLRDNKEELIKIRDKLKEDNCEYFVGRELFANYGIYIHHNRKDLIQEINSIICDISDDGRFTTTSIADYMIDKTSEYGVDEYDYYKSNNISIEMLKYMYEIVSDEDIITNLVEDNGIDEGESRNKYHPFVCFCHHDNVECVSYIYDERSDHLTDEIIELAKKEAWDNASMRVVFWFESIGMSIQKTSIKVHTNLMLTDVEVTNVLKMKRIDEYFNYFQSNNIELVYHDDRSDIEQICIKYGFNKLLRKINNIIITDLTVNDRLKFAIKRKDHQLFRFILKIVKKEDYSIKEIVTKLCEHNDPEGIEFLKTIQKYQPFYLKEDTINEIWNRFRPTNLIGFLLTLADYDVRITKRRRTE